MSSFPGSPKVMKGAIIGLDPFNPIARDPQFKFEYVTSTVSLLVQAGQGDSIVVHVVNDSGASENTRAIIYKNTGAGAITASDSGPVAVAPTWQWGLGFTIPES